MYGKNPVTKQNLRDDGGLFVNDVFTTIQGEGPDAGVPSIFVRLQGCNLRCWFCDTEFDTGKLRHYQQVADEVISRAFAKNIKLVVITGGEPLLQNFIPLVEACNNANLSVSVETAGTVYVPGIDLRFCRNNPWNNLIVCSPKTPFVNPDLVSFIGAFKYVVRKGETDPDDGLPLYTTQHNDAQQSQHTTRLYRPYNHLAPIYVQPMDEGEDLGGVPNAASEANRRLARDLCLENGHYRLSLQIHKIVNVP